MGSIVLPAYPAFKIAAKRREKAWLTSTTYLQSLESPWHLFKGGLLSLLCLPSSAKLKTLSVCVVTHSTGLPRSEVCLLSFHFQLDRIVSHSLKMAYEMPTSSQVPWYVTTHRPHWGRA